MPIDIEDYGYEERKMLIKEMFADGKYREGIREAVVAMGNLASFPEKGRYYLSFCKLAAMGYRKIGNYISAVETIKRGIKYVSEHSANDHSPHWNSELAILHMNLGAIYDSMGYQAKAIEECVFAGRIFEELNDYYHLMMVYETALVSFFAVGNYDKARETMRKMKLLSTAHEVIINPNVLEMYSNEMEETK